MPLAVRQHRWEPTPVRAGSPSGLPALLRMAGPHAQYPVAAQSPRGKRRADQPARPHSRAAAASGASSPRNWTPRSYPFPDSVVDVVRQAEAAEEAAYAASSHGGRIDWEPQSSIMSMDSGAVSVLDDVGKGMDTLHTMLSQLEGDNRSLHTEREALLMEVDGLRESADVSTVVRLEEEAGRLRKDLEKARDDGTLALLKEQRVNDGVADKAAAEVKRANEERDLWRQRADEREQELQKEQGRGVKAWGGDRDEVQRLRAQLMDAEKQVTQLQLDLARSNAAKKRILGQEVHVTALLAASDAKPEELNRGYFADINAQLNKDLTSIKAEWALAKETISHEREILKKQNDALAELEQDTHRRTEASRRQVLEAREEAVAVRTAADQDVAELHRKHTSSLAHMRGETREAYELLQRQHGEELRKVRRECNTEMAQRREDLEKEMISGVDAKVQLSSEAEKAALAKRDALQSQFTKLSSLYQARLEKCDSLAADVDRLEDALAKVEADSLEAADKDAQLSSLTDERNFLQTRVDALTAESSTTTAQLSSVRSLQQQLNDARAERDSLLVKVLKNSELPLQPQGSSDGGAESSAGGGDGCDDAACQRKLEGVKQQAQTEQLALATDLAMTKADLARTLQLAEYSESGLRESAAQFEAIGQAVGHIFNNSTDLQSAREKLDKVLASLYGSPAVNMDESAFVTRNAAFGKVKDQAFRDTQVSVAKCRALLKSQVLHKVQATASQLRSVSEFLAEQQQHIFDAAIEKTGVDERISGLERSNLQYLGEQDRYKTRIVQLEHDLTLQRADNATLNDTPRTPVAPQTPAPDAELSDQVASLRSDLNSKRMMMDDTEIRLKALKARSPRSASSENGDLGDASGAQKRGSGRTSELVSEHSRQVEEKQKYGATISTEVEDVN